MNEISEGTQNVVLQKASSHNMKKSIICKFWITGSCKKEEKCEYTHSVAEPYYYNQNILSKSSQNKVCPYYKHGFCKNGNYCSFLHVQNPESDINNYVPIWYLEYLYEKPISRIFEEFEECNPEETKEIKERINNTYSNQSINNKFKFKQHNNNTNYKPFKYNYLERNKDNISVIIESKARYFCCRVSNTEIVHKLLKNNLVPCNKQSQIIYKEAIKSCENVILIVFDSYRKLICGFLKLTEYVNDWKEELEKDKIPKRDIEEIIEQERYSRFFRGEWLWSSKLIYSRISNFENPLNNNNYLISSKDSQEISIDLGIYLCKLMMNRVSVKEGQVFQGKNNSMVEGFNTNNSPDSNKNEVRDNENNTIVLDNSIKNILYEEISSKSNINTDKRQKLQNPIIFTNISNLQVNITPPLKKENCKDERNEENSRSKEKKKHKKRKKEKKRKRSLSKEDCSLDESYHSDETVILEKSEKKEFKKQIYDPQLKRKRSRSSSRKKDSLKGKYTDSKNDFRRNNNNSFHSKLFSKAMENVAISFLKKNDRNYENSNRTSYK
jgi:hypothetical protein